MAYEQAFEKTPVGEIEVRVLPPARLLVSEMRGKYFDRSGTLFNRLFDYIKQNRVSMTVPVEGDVDQAAMRFHLGSDAPLALDETDLVRIEIVPERRVASIGGKGSYKKDNVNQARARLEDWLNAQEAWVPAGDPYAVYWNGPFTPWFMKRFEVHIPVERVPQSGTVFESL
jgi:DNA gyrase inhibitor GyrI